MTGIPGVIVAKTELPEVHGPIRDWLRELGLPKDWDALEAMAQPRGLSRRRLRGVLADEGPQRLAGNVRNRFDAWSFYDGGQLLTLAHLGYAIGLVARIWPGKPEEAPHAEGDFLMVEARLYDSALADRAWEGIRRAIFGAFCGVLVRPIEAPPGGGELVEVALAEADQVGCVNARILEAWESSLE